MSKGDDDPRLACGERGLAYHGPLMYEVKILKVFDPATGLTTSLQPLAAGAKASVPPKTITEKLPSPPESKRRMFFVHYKGWKASWDEWISTDRLLPFTEESFQKEKELRQQLKEQKKAAILAARQAKALAQASEDTDHSESRRGSAAGLKGTQHSGSESSKPQDIKPSRSSLRGSRSLAAQTGKPSKTTTATATNTTAASTASSTANGATQAAAEQSKALPEIKISMPLPLKAKLVDDWELVTKHKRQVFLPRKPSANDILDRFMDLKMPNGPSFSAARETHIEIITGLKLYFDRTLGLLLLYRTERAQWHEWLKHDPNISPGDLYGVEHLLRLFVALPGLISQSSLEGQALTTLCEKLEEFLEWLNENRVELFDGNYVDI